MIQTFFQRIEVLWWDIVIQALTHITPQNKVARQIYRFWKSFLLATHTKFLVLAAVGGFLTGMILAQITLH